MGETFYDLVLHFFTFSHNSHEEPQRIVSGAIVNLSMAFAYFTITGTIVWLTRKSMLLRRTPMVHMFALFILLGGLGHLGDLFGFQLAIQLTLDFVMGVVSVLTAIALFQKRHFILSVIYQFKYVVGLLKTLENIDDGEKTK